MKDITISKCKINFIINPRIELLSVIQIMAGENEKDYKEWYANNEFYITEIKKYFNDYKYPVVPRKIPQENGNGFVRFLKKLFN